MSALPWRQRFELTSMGNLHQAYTTGRGHGLGLTDGAPGRIPRGATFVDGDRMVRRLSDGELTSCPMCCAFPCNCESEL